MTIREDLIKILANIGDDYAGTIERLEEFVSNKQMESYGKAYNQCLKITLDQLAERGILKQTTNK